MAAPTYATDLQTYKDMTSTTGLAEPTSMTTLDGAGEVDSDLAIYGTQCITEAKRKTGLGAIVYTGTQPTWTAGETCYFAWFKWFAPNSLGTKVAQGGTRMLIGSTSANYRGWYVDGSDTYQYGGWVNYVVDPTQTGLATQTQGSPTTTYNTVGMGINTPNQSPSKGNSFNMDIIRYGRGEIRFTNGDLANGYATFDGMALVNDNATTGRWGLFQDVGGSYLWKGLMSVGTTTAVDMRDSNVVINIADTEMVATDFNRIEINNTSSNVEWTSVLISALGTRSKGEFEMIDECTVSLDTCVFTDMSTFGFLSGATIENSTFSRCALITTVAGTSFTNTTFDEPTGTIGLTTPDLELMTDCNFISDGTGHAIELTSIGGGSMDWQNDEEGYVTGPNTGSTGNETIYVNVGSGTLTINVIGGYSTPSVRTAGATVNVVAGQVTTTIHVTTTLGADIEGARVYMVTDTGGPLASGITIFNTLTNSSGEVTDTRGLVSDQPVVGRVRKSSTTPLYKTSPFTGIISSANGLSLTVLMIDDE